MLQRLSQSAIAFALTVVLYQAYVLAVVPFIDPPSRVKSTDIALNSDQLADARNAPNQYGELLAAYFPQGHWSLQRPPIAFENDELLIVLDDFTRSDDGMVRVEKYAAIYFPSGRSRTSAPPRDAIILEPSEPAVLQMDATDAKGPGGFGKLQRGWLHGKISVYSDMRQPGPDDDLRLITRDLYINEELIRSTEPVNFRLGDHRGRGRGLEIRLNDSQAAHEGSLVDGLSGFDSLEIASEVEVKVSLQDAGSLDQQLESRKDSSVHVNPSDSAEPPVVIACNGPLRLEFASYKATFKDAVVVQQHRPSGAVDRLNADVLNLYFDPSDRRSKSVSLVTPTRDDSRLGRIRLATVEAVGRRVTVDAPSREVVAEGGKMLLELAKRRITLELPVDNLDLDQVDFDRVDSAFDGSTPFTNDQVTATGSAAPNGPISEVMFRYRGIEVHSSTIQYTHPDPDSKYELGTFWASGDGWLRSVKSNGRISESIDVDWKHSMNLSHHSGQPVLSLLGRPTVTMASLGKLWADEMHLFLLEQAKDGKDSSVVADRLVASGRVAIDSTELIARVNEMRLWFNYPAEGLILAEPTGASTNPDDRSIFSTRERSLSPRYDLRGDQLNMQITSRQGKYSVSQISIEGDADFKELPSGRDDAPLHIRARSLHVDGADTPDANITIVGPAQRTASAPSEAEQKWAEISLGANTIFAEQLQISRGKSVAWIRTPGQIRLLIDRGFDGATLDAPQPIWVSWQDSMHLQGNSITFLGDVRARTPDGWLHTRKLEARLSRPVRFDGASQREDPELIRLVCSEGVAARFEQRDEAGPTSQQTARLQSLDIDLETGDFFGAAPISDVLGVIESVHLAADNPLAVMRVPLTERESGQLSSQPAQKLRHLRIEFSRGIQGNLHQKRATAFGNVKTLYGPVDSWDQRLNMDFNREPHPNEVWIRSDEQHVLQSPSSGGEAMPVPSRSQMGPLELTAIGGVEIDGYDPRKGYFTALGHRATYVQAKSMFILEGDASGPATVTHQKYLGSAPSPTSHRKLVYWLDSGNLTSVGTSARYEQRQ